METVPELIPIKFLPARADVERRSDGTLVVRSPERLKPYAQCLGEYLERWAAEKPNEIFLAQREGEAWRKKQEDVMKFDAKGLPILEPR